MPTLIDILNKTVSFFETKGVENARLDAQLILGKIMKLDRMELYLNYDRPLSETELEFCRGLVRRRALREPLQHILGRVQFREVSLKVDKRALIPRPETELLVDHVIAACRLLKKTAPSVLDVGVGTGALIFSIVKELPGVRVQGVELSNEALELARENGVLLGIKTDDLLCGGDTFTPFPSQQKWDIIASNPPYISKGEFPKLPPEVKDWDPEVALLGGEEGTEYPARLIQESFDHLEEGGHLIMEIGSSQAAYLTERARENEWGNIRVEKDYSGLDRFIWMVK